MNMIIWKIKNKIWSLFFDLPMKKVFRIGYKVKRNYSKNEVSDFTKKICERLSKNDRSALSKAITTIESKLESDYYQSQYILNFIKEKEGKKTLR